MSKNTTAGKYGLVFDRQVQAYNAWLVGIESSSKYQSRRRDAFLAGMASLVRGWTRQVRVSAFQHLHPLYGNESLTSVQKDCVAMGARFASMAGNLDDVIAGRVSEAAVSPRGAGIAREVVRDLYNDMKNTYVSEAVGREFTGSRSGRSSRSA